MTQIKRAVFPVAGLGTRFLPATKSIPKEIMTLVDRPLIQYAIDEARNAGIEEFVFVTSRGKSSLEDYFDINVELEMRLESKAKADLLYELRNTNMESGAIAYIRQTQPLGLGHAVNCARQLVGSEPFAVILTDDVVYTNTNSCLAQMVSNYSGGHMVAAMEVEGDAISSYGAIDPLEQNGKLVKVKGLVEKPKASEAPSQQAVIGRYILDPCIFDHLSHGRRGAGGEIQLTDAIDADAKRGKDVHGYLFDGQRFDCGSKLGYVQATIQLALDRPEYARELREFIRTLGI